MTDLRGSNTAPDAVDGGFDGSIRDVPDRWRVDLSDEIVSRLVSVGRRRSDEPLQAITFVDEKIPELESFAEDVFDRVSRASDGPGFAVAGVLPVRELSEPEVRVAYWVLGLHLGRPVTQNRAGDLIADVRMADTDGYRGFNKSTGGRFHSDFTHLGGLLSRRRAREGGESAVASSVLVHNELLGTDPGLVQVASEPYTLGRLREENPGEPAFTDHPIFARSDERFGAFYNYTLIMQGQEYEEVPRLTADQHAVCEEIDRITNCEGNAFRYLVEEGEILFFNNHQVLHSRTGFQDATEHDERRHLLRLWLEVDRLRDEVPESANYDYRFGSTGLGPEEVQR